jgi:amino acid permease
MEPYEEPHNKHSIAKRRESGEVSSSLLQDEIVVPVGDAGAQRYSGTWVSGILNLTQNILGAGILAMPSALANVGIVFGSALIIVSAVASAFGLYLLSLLAQNFGRKASFFSCSKITWPSLSIFFDLAIAIKCFGVSVSYLVICRDLLPQ